MDIVEIAKLVRKQLKKEFPKCLFSVRIQRFSMGQSMTIALMKAPFPAFAQDVDANGNKRLSDYTQLNPLSAEAGTGRGFHLQRRLLVRPGLAGHEAGRRDTSRARPEMWFLFRLGDRSVGQTVQDDLTVRDAGGGDPG